MKWHHIIGTVALAAVSMVPGCGGKSPAKFDTIFSPVYREFEPKVLLKAGAATPDDTQDRGSWNTKTLRGSRQLRGILPEAPEENPCAEILRRVDSFIAARKGKFSPEGQLPGSVRGDRKHVYGMWMYNCQDRHGEIHLWLFPDSADGTIAFAAHLYEEDLR